MLSTLGRLIWVPIAFLLSAVVAAGVVMTLFLERITQFTAGRDVDDVSVSGLMELMASTLYLAQALTILPALAVVVIGEVARIRSATYYIVASGIALVAVPLIARVGQSGTLDVPALAVWQVFATGGFIGGFVYWLLAGRRA